MSRDMTVLTVVLMFLVTGLVELALFKSLLYPSLRWRYERAKATLSTGIRPETILEIVRVQSLFLLPLIGTYLVMRHFSVVN